MRHILGMMKNQSKDGGFLGYDEQVHGKTRREAVGVV